MFSQKIVNVIENEKSNCKIVNAFSRGSMSLILNHYYKSRVVEGVSKVIPTPHFL